jgi:hypothetical protein
VTRQRREPRVHASSLQDLPTGSAWLRIAPVGTSAREQIERLVIALPAPSEQARHLALPPGGPSASSVDGYQTRAADGPVGRNDPERVAVTSLVAEPDDEGCRRWQGSFDQDGYPRAWWDGGYRRAARLLYRWDHGEIPSGHTLDHLCRHRWCVEVAHLEPVPRAEDARREAERRRKQRSAVAPRSEPPTTAFAIALFGAVDRPAINRLRASSGTGTSMHMDHHHGAPGRGSVRKLCSAHLGPSARILTCQRPAGTEQS